VTIVDKPIFVLQWYHLIFNDKGQEYQKHMSRTFQGHNFFTCVTCVCVFNFPYYVHRWGPHSPCGKNQQLKGNSKKIKILKLNWVHFSLNFGEVVFSGTTQGWVAL